MNNRANDLDKLLAELKSQPSLKPDEPSLLTVDLIPAQPQSFRDLDSKVSADKSSVLNSDVIMNLGNNMPSNKDQTLGEFLATIADTQGSISGQVIGNDLLANLEAIAPSSDKSSSILEEKKPLFDEYKAQKIESALSNLSASGDKKKSPISKVSVFTPTQAQRDNFETISKEDVDPKQLFLTKSKPKAKAKNRNELNYINTKMKLVDDNQFSPLNLPTFISKI